MTGGGPERTDSRQRHTGQEGVEVFLHTTGCVIAALILMASSLLVSAAANQAGGSLTAGARGPTEEGAELYRGYCAACHGAGGVGDGPVASALKTRPTNLTRLAATNRGIFPAQRVAMVLEFGVMVAAHGTTDMPTWGATFRAMGDDVLVRQRVAALTRHLQTIQAR